MEITRGGAGAAAASAARPASGANGKVAEKQMKSPLEGYSNRERGEYAVYHPGARGRALDIVA